MKKNFSKKLLSFALAFALVIGMLPQISTAAFADTGSTEGAYWPNFRGSDTNMAITSVETPRGNAVRKWNKTWSTPEKDIYPSQQIIVDNALVALHGDNISMLSLEDGSTLKTAKMAGTQGYVSTAPTYADGKIFCVLDGGKIQAFDAKTLESAWDKVYEDPKGGTCDSPITYSDGYIYTGFGNSWFEKNNRNYVCIDAATGQMKWRKTDPNGFVWAGSVVIGDGVIFGSQAGSDGYSKLYSIKKNSTGENPDVISEITIDGSISSSIAYDKVSGRIYFTTKSGYLYSAEVDAVTGEVKATSVKCEKNHNSSTSTPVVYKNRVYYGASGVNQWSDPGKIIVADAGTLNKLFEIEIPGEGKSSLLLSTAYEESEGLLYLYTSYNAHPGGIILIKVEPDCLTASDAEKVELFNAAGFEQYCALSIICGPDGTLYYRNDSTSIFAIGVTGVESVENLINKIGTVTIDSENAIKTARDAYDKLSDSDKALVSNYTKLEKAEKDFAPIAKKVENVEMLIAAIGKVSNDDATKAKVKAARDAYEKLSPEEQAKVNNYNMLIKAELVFNAPERVENTVNKDNACSGTLANTNEEIFEKVLGDDDKFLVETGKSAKVTLSVKDINNTVSLSDKALIEKNLGKNKVGLYLDITLSKQVGDNTAVNVTETNGKVKVTISVPDSLKNSDASITRTYKIMRIHEGKVDILDATYDAKTGKLVFETDAFSTYALVYSDAPVQTTAPKTGDINHMASWIAIMAAALAVAALLKKKTRE